MMEKVIVMIIIKTNTNYNNIQNSSAYLLKKYGKQIVLPSLYSKFYLSASF